MHTVAMLAWVSVIDVALLFFVFVLIKSLRGDHMEAFVAIDKQVNRGQRVRAPFLTYWVWVVIKLFGYRMRIFGLVGCLMSLTAAIITTVQLVEKLAP